MIYNNFSKKKIDKKSKSLYKNVILSYFIKGASLVISFLLTPIYIEYLGNQVILGVWFTILSVMNWILFFDFGLGNGLRNRLTTSLHENNYSEAKKLISSTYIIMGAISIIFFLMGFLLISIIDLNKFFNVSSDIISEKALYVSVLALFIGTVAVFFFNIIIAILHSLQKSGITGFFGLLTNIMLVIAMKTINFNNSEKNLLFISIVFAISFILPLVIATIIVFSTTLKECKPKVSSFENKVAKNMLKLGGAFFWIQLTIVLINSTDQILISKLFGNDQVVPFQLYHKLLYVFVTLFTIITNPIWSSVSKAKAEKDYKWIKKTKNKLYLIAVLFAIGIIAFLLIIQFVFDLWLGKNTIDVSYGYAIVFALYSISMIFLFSITAIANGLGELKAQLICFTIGMIIKIPVVYMISRIVDLWIIVVVVDIIILAISALINIISIEGYLKKENKYRGE